MVLVRFIRALAAVFLAYLLTGAATAQSQAIPTPTPGKGVLHLSAVLSGQSEPVRGGLHWRIYSVRPDLDGSHGLAGESTAAQPTFVLAPGDYVVHLAFGLAGETKRVTLAAEERSDRVTLNAGALKIEATLADAPVPAPKLAIQIFVPERHNPEAKLVDAKAVAGQVIGLPEGAYHIVSTYLDTVGVGSLGVAKSGTGAAAPVPTNSVVSADIKVLSGKIIDLTLRHRVATLTLKLVNAPGAEALANTNFTVLTPGGDLIRELIGAFPSLVLAEGDYVVIARHDQKTYQSTFQVQSALDRDVEVIAQ
ncbi:MAG TPA: hypothetical protein VKS78_18365 [Roseiarcus sp.]|nr:hypothetical protein [Roseiarcus sp.]